MHCLGGLFCSRLGFRTFPTTGTLPDLTVSGHLLGRGRGSGKKPEGVVQTPQSSGFGALTPTISSIIQKHSSLRAEEAKFQLRAENGLDMVFATRLGFDFRLIQHIKVKGETKMVTCQGDKPGEAACTQHQIQKLWSRIPDFPSHPVPATPILKPQSTTRNASETMGRPHPTRYHACSLSQSRLMHFS